MTISHKTYSLSQYWELLKEALQKEAIASKNQINQDITEEDEKAYLAQKNALSGMLKYGLEIEALPFYKAAEKKAKGAILDNIAKSYFGEKEVPVIKGPKSLAFAKEIYLPHMKRFSHVSFHPVIIQLAKLIGVDIKKRQDNVVFQVQALEKSIKAESIKLIRKNSGYDFSEFKSPQKVFQPMAVEPLKPINQELINYKQALLDYLNKVIDADHKFVSTAKGFTLYKVRQHLEAGNYRNHGLEQMKTVVSDIRKITAVHRDSGIIGFFKATWARNTRTYNELSAVFDEQNNIKPKR